MNVRFVAIIVTIFACQSGCATIVRSMSNTGSSGSRSGSGGSREDKVRADAIAAKNKFLALQAPDSAASHRNWIKEYEKARGYCHTWAWKNHGMKDKIEACAKEVNSHYLKLASPAVEMLIAKDKGLQAHWAVRKIGDHSRHRFWNLDSQAPKELAEKAAAARVEWAQKMYASTKRYAEPNSAGCVASSKPLPKGNTKISNIVFHASIGQRLNVRCFMQTRISSLMMGKDSPALRGEINTTDQNLANCKGYTCDKDPDVGYYYALEID